MSYFYGKQLAPRSLEFSSSLYLWNEQFQLLCSVAGQIYVQMTFILSYKLMSCFYQPEPVYGPVHVYVVQEPKKVVRYQKSSVV